MRLTIARKGLILVVLPLLFQLAFLWVLHAIERSHAEAENWTAQSRNVITEANRVLRDLFEIRGSARGYVITNDPEFLEPYRTASGELPAAMQNLVELVRDNPQQAQRARDIQKCAVEAVRWWDEVNRLVQSLQNDIAVQRVKSKGGKRYMDELGNRVDAFLQEEGQLLAARQQSRQRSRDEWNWILLAGVVVSFSSAVSLGLFFNRGIRSRLGTLIENTRLLAEARELAPPVGGHDEITRLDSVFRTMADSLAEAAERRREYTELLEQRVLERKRAEEQFRLTVEAAPNAMIMINRERRITLVNAQTERLFGYARGELLGQPIELLMPQRFRPQHPGHVDRFFAAPQPRPMGAGWNLFGLRNDGTEVSIEIGLSPLTTAEGTFALASVIDVTERKRAEQQLRDLNELLEDRVAARTAELSLVNQDLEQQSHENEMFVYSVSHDLRSPLVNLQGFSKELGAVADDLHALLDDPSLPLETRKRANELITGDMQTSIHFIQSAVTRLSGIIDALLRLSRAGRVEYQVQRVDVENIVTRIVESLGVTIYDRGAQIALGSLPPCQGDAQAIEQVFANLIGNALNYLDPGRPGRIEIGSLPAERNREDDNTITYFIKDNGLGISQAHQPQLFQAFKRLHPEVAQGEGIGLAMARRIAERHGGRIWVESASGVGSTFFVALPAEQTTSSPSPSDRPTINTRSSQDEYATAGNLVGGR